MKEEQYSESESCTFSGLHSRTRYTVSVVIVLSVGEKPATAAALLNVTTLPAPDSAMNLTVEVTYNRTRFTWTIGSDSGNFSHFLLELVGSQQNHRLTYYNFTQNVTQPLKESYSADISTINLTAEARYNVTVTSVSSNGTSGVKQTTNFTVPARIPAEPLKVNLSLLRVEHVGTSSAQVHLHRDLFPDTEGQVIYYAILVVENGFADPPRAKALPFGSWPNHTTWAQAQTQSKRYYQVTPTRWQPFKDDNASMAIFAVGVNNSCSVMDRAHYCNGPLKASTDYALRVRGFTSAGYRDCHDITFRTDGAPSLVLILLSVLMVLAATSVVMFLYFATKEHQHWLVEQRKQEDLKLSQNILSEFVNHAELLLANKEALQEEFNKLTDLCQLIPVKQTVARLPNNKGKNRYANILPYDDNRVKLKGKGMNDYINASHIMLQNGKSAHYLACQGPREWECENFWSMMIQNKAIIIVMLCMPTENGKEKCFPYFPMVGHSEIYGETKVYCVSELNNKNYIIRNLRVKQKGISMEFTQFHYTSWPDFDFPPVPEDLVQFIRAVRQAHSRNTVIAVHCSAGVGRSGTFIALDALLTILHTSYSRINVVQTVYELRKQRCNMVQTKKQYELIYKCLKYVIENDPSHSTKDIAKISSASSIVEMDNLPSVDSLERFQNIQKDTVETPL